jgi:hypothetical protein
LLASKTVFNWPWWSNAETVLITRQLGLRKDTL